MGQTEQAKEKARRYAREYRAANPDKVKAQNKSWYEKNKEKALADNRAYHRENREKVNVMRRTYRAANRARINARNRRANTGFTKEMFDSRMAEQEYKCAICGSIFSSGLKANADHDHETGKQRGILCSRCNVMLGMSKDNKSVLSKAIQYLAEWEAR